VRTRPARNITAVRTSPVRPAIFLARK
jgi:hypothetical protein